MLKVVLSMPNLSTMDIRAAMPDLAQILHTHPVQEARIRKFRLCAPQFMSSGLPRIISSLFPSRFEVLSIAAHDGWACDAMEFSLRHKRAVIDFKMLKPLLQFVHLRLISLPDHAFDLTDVEIKDMALAWPNLEELSYWQYEYMSPEGLITTVPKTSLRGLLWLATHCRKLHSLFMPTMVLWRT